MRHFAKPLDEGGCSLTVVGRCSLPLLQQVSKCYVVTTDTQEGIRRLTRILASKVVHLCHETYVLRVKLPRSTSFNTVEAYMRVAWLFFLDSKPGDRCLVLQDDAAVPRSLLQIDARRFGEVDAFLTRMPTSAVFSLGSLGHLSPVPDPTNNIFRLSPDFVSAHAIVAGESLFRRLLHSPPHDKIETVLRNMDVYSYAVAVLVRHPGRSEMHSPHMRRMLSTRGGWDAIGWLCRHSVTLPVWLAIQTALLGRSE